MTSRALSRHVLPDGRALLYEHHTGGPPGAPIVAFLNGLSQTTVAWGLQTQRLRGVRATLVHDAAGQGKSDPAPEGHRPAGHARDLLHLCDTLGIGALDLVGFSFGARIALRTALAAPDRVRRMVLVGCAHRDTALRRWIVQGWLDALEKGGVPHVFQIVTPQIVGETWLARYEHTRASMLRAFASRSTAEGMRRLLLDTLMPGGDLTDELRALRQPTLVIRGESDFVVSKALNHELIDLLPDARYVECPDAGHTVAIEQPDWFADRVAEFLVGP
jgi:pimeloyl-ACP methyl ester carboxylesterase